MCQDPFRPQFSFRSFQTVKLIVSWNETRSVDIDYVLKIARLFLLFRPTRLGNLLGLILKVVKTKSNWRK